MSTEMALVLDDDEFCRSLLVDVIQSKQIKVMSYADPVRLLETLSPNLDQLASLFDYIITDNLMPRMTGLEFLEKLNAECSSFPAERTAIISGAWSDSDLERARQLGCRVFKKPYEFSKLDAWIEEIRDIV